MRIIVFSDTHGYINNCISVLESIKNFDMIIHAGDVLRDCYDLNTLYPDIPVYFVPGNNDFSNLPSELLIDIGEFSAFITHGHSYHVKKNTNELSIKAKSLGADIAIFGHTHNPKDIILNNIQLFNPGSISRPASIYPTYGVIEIDNNKLKTAIINFI